MCDKLRIIRKFQLIGLHKTTTAIKLHFHLVWPRILLTWLLQSLSTGPMLSLQVPYWPRVVFGPGRTWQDRPWPVLFMLAHGNAIWLVWMITTATAGWPAASRNQGHSTSALRTFPALFSSACRWIIHPVQLGGTDLLHKHYKTAHSVYWYNNL